MKLHRNKRYFFLLLIYPFLSIHGYAQSISDSLTFQNIIDVVIKNNPVLKQAEDKVAGSQWKEQLTKSTYLPNIYASANASRLYPIPAFDFSLPNPQTGEMVSTHFQMLPDVSMDYALEINQMVYDFGKTKHNLGMQETFTEMGVLNVEQLKQKLVLTAAGYFFSLLYLQSAIVIKKDEVSTLNQHLEFIEKKQLTGSATQYEVLSTKVRISNQETQLADLQTSCDVLVSHLNSLMGIAYTSFSAKNSMIYEKPTPDIDTLFDYALTHRYEMLLAVKNKSIAVWNYKVEQSKDNPSLSFFGRTGFKNGYLSEINVLKYNYIAGLNLKIPIFNGNRSYINKQIANLGIEDSRYEIENLQHEISDDIKENLASLELSAKKIEQFSVQIEQAAEAYNHAKTNYEAGVITNLDL
jgi:outer membrane protein